MVPNPRIASLIRIMGGPESGSVEGGGFAEARIEMFVSTLMKVTEVDVDKLQHASGMPTSQ